MHTTSSPQKKSFRLGKYLPFLFLLLLLLAAPEHHAHAETPIWAAIAAKYASAKASVFDWIGGILLRPFLWIAELINWCANKWLLLGGYLLDNSILYTINSDIYKNVSAIQVGWTAVRDFSNMFFIFALLYIAIYTILGLAGSGTKKMVANLIIAAVLINFSLFFTQVIIDAGNILALGFWNKIVTKQGAVTGSSAAAFFMEGFKVQTEFDTLTDANGEQVNVSTTNKIVINLGGALVSFVGGYVMIAGAIMMIIRSVWLMILMIASPFAFLSYALPVGGSYANKWFSDLIGQTFVAPAFVFMLYIDSLIIRGTGAGSEIMQQSGADTAKWAQSFVGNSGSFGIVYNFILLIVLMLASLKVASAVSSGTANQASSLAKRFSLGAGSTVVAGGMSGLAFAQRQTRGRAAARELDNNKALHHTATLKTPEGDKARKRIAELQKQATSSYDIRNSRTGRVLTSGLAQVGIDTGGQKIKSGTFKPNGEKEGFVDGRSKKEKEVEDDAKRLFPDNPEAQKHYIEGKLGSAWTDTDRNKKAREALDKSAAQEGAKKKILTESTNYDAQKTQNDTLKAQHDALVASGTATPAAILKAETDLNTSNKSLQDSLDEMTKQLKLAGTKHLSEMDLDSVDAQGKLTADAQENRKFLKSEAFLKAAGNDHLKAIENRDDVDRSYLGEVRDAGLQNGSDRTKEYLKRQMRNDDSRFFVDHKKELDKEIGVATNDPTYAPDIATIDRLSITGPLTPADDAALKQAQARVKVHHDRVATRLGYMAPEKVAALEPDVLLERSSTQSLTPAMLQEIVKTEKTTFKYGAPFFADLKSKIEADPNANKAAKAFVDRASKNKDSPFNPNYGTP